MIPATGALLAAVVVLACSFVYKKRRYEGKFAHLPGPRGIPFLQNSLQLHFPTLHKILTKWGETYGPVYKIGMLGKYAVVINGYDAIRECLVDGGYDTAGRPEYFRVSRLFEDTGFNQPTPDDKWRLTRKVFYKFTKQFDAGLHVLEEAIAKQAEEMFEKFNKLAEESREADPRETVTGVSLKTIALIICGENLEDDDPLFTALREYESLIWTIFPNVSFQFVLLDMIPVLIHAPLRSSRLLKLAILTRDTVALELKQRASKRNPEDTLVGFLDQFTGNRSGKKNPEAATSVKLDEADVLLSTVSVLFAGIGTSSTGFNSLINILAHNQAIQKKIHKEISSVSPDPDENVTLQLRADMPYTRATLLEMQRYHSIAPVLTIRATVCDTTVCGVTIPAKTQLMCNLWGMHHDKDFWGDPEQFRPERFLDQQGDLVSPGDPKRRHLMPFSAGVRNCPGEQFAMSRLFLWLTNMCKRFEVFPGKENSPDSIRSENFRNNFLMQTPDYKVTFKRRDSVADSFP